ncbi:MAG: hypothetical protein HOP96_00360 [Sphingomonas sp.]|nr:hypothetical protein [Sphingomonas sp.]
MENASGTNRLDVLKASFWPAIALIVLIALGGPIKDLVKRISRDTGAATEIEVGPVKLKFSEAAKSVPPPSSEIAEALVQLKPEELDRLLSHAEGHGYGVCTVKGVADSSRTSDLDQARAYLHFSELGLVEFTTPPFAVEACSPGEARLAQLTDLGKATRRYAVDVLTRTVTISQS